MPGAEFVDDAHRLVADYQSRPDRVLALENVDVGATDRRRRDADDCFADASSRLGHGLDADVAGAVEYGRAHRAGLQRSWSAGFCECHGGPLFRSRWAGRVAQCVASRPPTSRHRVRGRCRDQGPKVTRGRDSGRHARHKLGRVDRNGLWRPVRRGRTALVGRGWAIHPSCEKSQGGPHDIDQYAGPARDLGIR